MSKRRMKAWWQHKQAKHKHTAKNANFELEAANDISWNPTSHKTNNPASRNQYYCHTHQAARITQRIDEV
jgi:hypothetical protein